MIELRDRLSEHGLSTDGMPDEVLVDLADSYARYLVRDAARLWAAAHPNEAADLRALAENGGGPGSANPFLWMAENAGCEVLLG